MKSKTQFELHRWIYFVILWLIGTGLCIAVIEIIFFPAFQWFFYDIPYALPTWNLIGRWSLGILFIGFFAGTISWYVQKRNSGR
ncbi:hypothetical protein [Glaciimonas sp. PCH181]|uniref:hypothetical protein n=1 Tax=Glaciimonas sp. PCH181 TaxID=2133943 RepID=UPI000D351489|nr:hypothetical protein [Glaciimonas sp. PCH181]PUA18084.1 hypothetical protein C7W93_19865 [Glaciimonas sp. PCH181]